MKLLTVILLLGLSYSGYLTRGSTVLTGTPEQFIQGRWRAEGTDPSGRMGWYLEWTFDQGKFKLTGYPPLVQDGNYRIQKIEGNKLSLELYKQKGNFGTEDSRIEVKIDQAKDTLIIKGQGPFRRIKALADSTSDLSISITLTTTEHSRDSSSTNSTITVNGNKILFEETYGGYRSGKRIPVHKEKTITNENLSKLANLIKEKNLLTSESLEYPPATGPYTWYELTVELGLQGKKSSLKVAGPVRSEEMKNNRLYQDTDALLEAVRQMIDEG